MRLKTASILSALLIAASATVAQAQDYPDMVGDWSGLASGVVIGDPAHFDPADATSEDPRSAEFEMTISIVGQEGRYVWGTISGGGSTEPWLGTLWDDGSGYRATDSNGFVEGRFISDDQVENCYLHTGETMVASCAILTRS